MNVSRKQLFALIYTGLLLLCALVWYSLALAPVFSLSMLAIVLAVVFYIQTEKHGVVHAASEFENRFWTTIAFIVSVVCFRVSDSPLYLPGHLAGYSWYAVALATFMAHNYDRHCRRLQLKRDLQIRCELPVDEKMRNLLDEVRNNLSWIDNPWISSTIMNIFMLSKVLATEKQLIQIFSDCTQQELNYLVTHSLALIMYKMKDHKWVKKYYRTQFIETLAVRRICELSTFSRCILVDALQSMKLSAHPKAEHYVKNIFLKTYGDSLSELKCLSDSKGDFQSMHKLLYFDILNKDVRNSILEHIKTQARVQKAHMKLGTSHSRRRGEFAWRKILSDVDDTLLCSGGAYPAGVDRSLPRKILYPGVLGFYRELDLGDTGPSVWEPGRVGNLVFLSARPHVYSDIAEKHVYDSLNNLQRTRGLYTAPSLLCGSMKTGAQYMFNNTMEPLAKKKVESFKEYAALYAEFEFVFIGDNGQGDVRAAELIHEDSLYAGNLKRAYMHKVKPLSETHCEKEETKSINCPYIFYFTTYVEAAVDAFKHELIRISGLRQIALEAVKDFERIDWDLFGNKRTYANMQSPRMESFASNQNISSGVSSKRGAPKTFGVSLKESFRKRYMRLKELNEALVEANVLLVQHGLKPVALLKFECLYKVGTQVITPFGPGVVEWFRPHDGTYEVLLQLGIGDSEDAILSANRAKKANMAYLRSDSLLPFRQATSSWIPSLTPHSQASFVSMSSANNVLRDQLKKHKKSGSQQPAKSLLGKSEGGSIQRGEEDITVYKWVVWTPFGLGILLPDKVEAPPPPLPEATGSKKASDTRSTHVVMVKVRTGWGAVLSILRKDIVKMKLITTHQKLPSLNTTDEVKVKETPHVSKLVVSQEESDGHELPLKMRALLSPSQTGRKRSTSVDGGDMHSIHSDSAMNESTQKSGFGLNFIPLYKRFFGSDSKRFEKESLQNDFNSHENKNSEGDSPFPTTDVTELIVEANNDQFESSSSLESDGILVRQNESFNDLSSDTRNDAAQGSSNDDDCVGLNIDNEAGEDGGGTVFMQVPSLTRNRSSTFS